LTCVALRATCFGRLVDIFSESLFLRCQELKSTSPKLRRIVRSQLEHGQNMVVISQIVDITQCFVDSLEIFLPAPKTRQEVDTI
jgi:hypothetical protein